MTPPEEIQFTCSECQKQFDPDPDWVLVEEIDAIIEPSGCDEDCDCCPAEGHALSPESREEVKANLGINDDELNEILRGGKVAVGGVIICKECQDQLAEAAP